MVTACSPSQVAESLAIGAARTEAGAGAETRTAIRQLRTRRPAESSQGIRALMTACRLQQLLCPSAIRIALIQIRSSESYGMTQNATQRRPAWKQCTR